MLIARNAQELSFSLKKCRNASAVYSVINRRSRARQRNRALRSDWPLFSSIDGVFVNLSVKIWGDEVQTAVITKCSPFCVDQHLHTHKWSECKCQHLHTRKKTYHAHTSNYPLVVSTFILNHFVSILKARHDNYANSNSSDIYVCTDLWWSRFIPFSHLHFVQLFNVAGIASCACGHSETVIAITPLWCNVM